MFIYTSEAVYIFENLYKIAVNIEVQPTHNLYMQIWRLACKLAALQTQVQS